MNNAPNFAALASLLPALAAPTPAALAPLATARRIPGVAPLCFGLEISEDEYHGRLSGISSSALKKALRSPAHYRAYLVEPDRDDAARKFGRAVHALLLEPHSFDDRFAVWSDGRRAGWRFEEFCEQHPGKTVLTEDEHRRAVEAALELRNNPDFPLGVWLDGLAATANHDAVPAAKAEFTIVWVDEETGLECKARIDAHSPTPQPLAFDAKTTDDARKAGFRRQFAKQDYDLQAAHYCAGLKAFYGVDFPFLFGAVEAKAPHGTGIFGMSAQLLANGEQKRRHALALLKRCQDTNLWPKYETGGIQTLELGFMDRFDAKGD
jgi:hypothetical protein